MIAYKFLAAGAVGPFTGFQWEIGVWVEGPLDKEGFGVHACRPADLAWWIGAELWRVELDGPVRERATQIEAARGRLLDRVSGWDATAQAQFGLDCVFQAREVAAGSLRTLGFAELAAALAVPRTLEELAKTARSLQPPPGFAGEMFGYAHDASVAFSLSGNAAESSFIASVATAAARGNPAGFREEKGRESRWLIEQLGLAAA